MQDSRISEKIIEYVDGELPVSEEPSLFSSLAESEELRAEMREQLRISRIVSKDRGTLIPSPSITLGVLSALGFVQEAPNSPLTAPINVGKFSLWQKIRIPFTVAVLSSLLTFLSVYFFMRQSKDGENKYVSKPAIVQTPPIIITSLETTSKTKHTDKSTFYTQVDRHKYEGNLIVDSKEISNNQANFFVDRVNPPQNDISILPIKENNVNSLNRIPTFIFQRNKIDNIQGNGRYTLILRGMQGFTFPNPDVNTNDALLFSNMSIGFYFLKFSRVQFGVEFGREIFGQRFVNTVNNIDFYYEQKPMLYWGAVGTKYYIADNFLGIKDLSPTATLLAGGSQVGGPLIKLLLGLNWDPKGTGLGMYLGVESSVLTYQNQNRFYWSKKFGLTYGMLFNF